MRHTSTARRACAALLALCLAGTPATRAAEPDSANALVDAAAHSVGAILVRPEWEGVRNLLAGSRAVFIAPHQTRIGLLAGIEHGSGIILARHGESWSDPVFVGLNNLDVGFLAGVSDSTTMMLILTRHGLDEFLDGSSRVSGTGGFALAEWGVSGLGAGGLSGGVQAVTVETSRGLFAGGGFGAARMQLDDARNQQAYGAGFDAGAVLRRPGGSVTAAATLRYALSRAALRGFAGD